MKVAKFQFTCRKCGREQTAKAMWDPQQTSGTRIRCKACRATNYNEGPPEATL
ncbi:MAG: hypothetical protein HQRvContig01_18 [Haloquadratum phage sp.]|nr:MAG: hypothetical protein HQRvContig01_18 [Haloquadratum phage sp.]